MKQELKQYIIDCIDASGYELKQQPRNNAEKLQFLFDTFKSEYGWNIERMGAFKAFQEWIQGLPSSFNIDFTYCDIIERCKTVRPSKYSESKLCSTWFQFIASSVFRLWKEYKIADCNISVSELRYIHEHKGTGFFFSRDTMRFFKDTMADFYAYKDMKGDCYITNKKRGSTWLFDYATGSFNHVSKEKKTA